jgi:hypothetical protein
MIAEDARAKAIQAIRHILEASLAPALGAIQVPVHNCSAITYKYHPATMEMMKNLIFVSPTTILLVTPTKIASLKNLIDGYIKNTKSISPSDIRSGIPTPKKEIESTLEEMGIHIDELPVASEAEMLYAWSFKADSVGPLAAHMTKIQQEKEAIVARKEKRPLIKSGRDQWSDLKAAAMKREQMRADPGEQVI